jgi:hypothetical protein
VTSQTVRRGSSGGAPAGSVLSGRALGRATLARQYLLERSDLGALAMIEHLVGMQAQAPYPPYTGLWSRIREFRHEQLAGLLLDRSVTRILLQRGTVHLVSAADCHLLRPVVQPVIERMYVTAKEMAAAGDPKLIARHTHELMAGTTMTPVELGAALADRIPGGAPRSLSNIARALVPMVQTPPRAVWGAGGTTRYALSDEWLGTPASRGLQRVPTQAVQDVIRRYLGAFGPATVADVQAWCGLTKLQEITDQMPDLLTFRTEGGRDLLDVPGAALPGADAPAPVRYLPEFDNVVLSHTDRSRLIDNAHRPVIFSRNGLVAATFLIDGRVGGTWRCDAGVVSVTSFAPLSAEHAQELAREGIALGRFLSDPGTDVSVRFLRA